MIVTKADYNTTDAAPQYEEAQQKKDLSEVFTKFARYKMEGEPYLSGLSTNSTWTMSDMSSLERLSEDLLRAISTVSPDTFNGAVKDALASGGTNLGYHAFGTVSGLNLLIGTAQVIEAVKQAPYSDAIGDKRGALMNRLGILKGVTLAAGGGLFGVYRGVEIAHCVETSSEGLTKAASVLSIAGTVCYIGFYLLLVVLSGIRLYEGAKFRYKLNQAKSLNEAVALLNKKLHVDPQKVLERLQETKKGALKEYLTGEGYASGIRYLKALRKEMKLPPLSDEDLRGQIDQVLGDHAQEYLEHVGLQIEVDKIVIKKEAKLSRVLGPSGLREIKKLSQMISTEDQAKIVDAVKGASTKEMAIKAFILTVCLLGIGVMVGALVFSGGGAILPMVIVALVVGLSMFAVDTYYLWQSYQEDSPAVHDKKMLALSSLVGIASFITVIALMASGTVTMGILPAVVAFVLLGLWLGQNGLSWAVILYKERCKKLEDEEESDKVVRRLFQQQQEVKVTG